MSRTPVILVSGVAEAAMLDATMSLQLGLPDAVVVRHVIERGRLIRTVSDLTGVVERHEVDLEHACVACAIREDVVPTLERLAESGRWSSIVACLPVSAEAVQVCRVLAWAPGNAPHVRIASVVAALDGESVAEDLLGDDLLDERGLATSDDDRRGVAEVACAMVEHADVVALTIDPLDDEQALIEALVRPGVPVVHDTALLDGAALAASEHVADDVESWVAPVRREPLPRLRSTGAWRVDLRSERPIHPGRLLAHIERLGAGPRRIRGCFWLPTRPDDVCVWDGAGGQVSVGSTERWSSDEAPLTRLVVVGLGEEPDPDLVHAFGACLLEDAEMAARGPFWEASEDGLEPWLGPVRGLR